MVDHDDPFNAYFTILSRYVKIFRAFQDDPTTALGTSSNTIPQTLYLKHVPFVKCFVYLKLDVSE